MQVIYFGLGSKKTFGHYSLITYYKDFTCKVSRLSLRAFRDLKALGLSIEG